MPTNTTADRTILAGLFKKGYQKLLTWFSGGVATGAPGSVANVQLGTNLTGTQVGDTLTIIATSGSSSPLTTKGDVYTRNATVDARLPVGADGTVLTADSTAATGNKWAAPSGASPLTTKGDIYVRNATIDTRFPVGPDGTVVSADSTTATGLRYVYVPTALNPLSVEILADGPTSYYKCTETVSPFIDYGSAGINVPVGVNAVLAQTAGLNRPSNEMFPIFSNGAAASYCTTNGNPTGTTTPSANYSMECLLLDFNAGGYRTMFSLYDTSALGNAIFWLGMHLNTLSVFSNNAEVVLTKNNFNPMFYRGVHIVVNAFIGSRFDTYINGAFVGSATPCAYPAAAVSPGFIAVGGSAGENMGGALGHVALYYNKTLSVARIVAHAKAAGLYGL